VLTRLACCGLQAAGRAGTAQLVQMVARRVVEILDDIGQFPRIKQLELPATLVGLDEQKEQVMQHLMGGSTARRMVLLHGMAGIGKTTLAKAVFNQLQESNRTVPCCFLRLGPGVNSAGTIAKQRQLLMDLCNLDQDLKLESAEQGRRMLAQKLRGKRVLLLLDDVWDDQLEWLLPGGIMEVLGGGSVVLATSRDLGSVRGFGPGVGVLETEAMPAQQSLELFCWHAFGSNSVPTSDNQWSKQIEEVVARCGGLPAAVVAVGRHLSSFRGKRSAFFRKADEALVHAFGSQKAQWKDDERTVLGALRCSWDALGRQEQEDLLDIVWFLQGQPWDVVHVYCRFGVLDRLHDLAFVHKFSAKGELPASVEVAPVMAQFCKAAAGTHHGRRSELGGSAKSGRNSGRSLSLPSQVSMPIVQHIHAVHARQNWWCQCCTFCMRRNYTLFYGCTMEVALISRHLWQVAFSGSTAAGSQAAS
jgi:DNA polymerase III delta prime subunit